MEKTIEHHTLGSDAVASIHLYGTHEGGHGFGVIVVVRGKDGAPNRRFGESSAPSRDRSATDALFLGVHTLHTVGLRTGTVEVHYDFPLFGASMATFDLAKTTPYFGELKWGKGARIVVMDDTQGPEVRVVVRQDHETFLAWLEGDSARWNAGGDAEAAVRNLVRGWPGNFPPSCHLIVTSRGQEVWIPSQKVDEMRRPGTVAVRT